MRQPRQRLHMRVIRVAKRGNPRRLALSTIFQYRRQFRNIAHAHLCQYPAAMHFDRPHGDTERIPDLLVKLSLEHQAHHFRFPGGK